MFTRFAATAVISAAVFVPAAAPALGQQQPDLSALPGVIKDLKWKEIDAAAITAPERCRALNFLNDAFDEIGAAGRAEADLLSAFIDERELGPRFTQEAAPEAPPLTYDDTVKISVAMVRGPMASSSYASQFADDADANTLTAYQNLFESTCRRKYTEVVEAKLQVRAMTGFLQQQKLMDAYKAWLPQEVARREKAHEEAMAQRRAEAESTAEAKAQAAKEAAEERRARKEQEAAARQVQRELERSQLAAQPQQGEVVEDYDDDDWYPVWGYGASGWYADPAYRGRAGADVENRMSRWSGGGGRRGGRGRR